MSDAILTGYAIPTTVMPGADHTYVLSSVGHVWPCWGRDNGGTKICEGKGDADVADCLSKPDSKAGISYGKTGVCHQTANRILLPAKVFVDQARRYRWSVTIWSTFGRHGGRASTPTINPWPEIARCGA